MYNSLALAFSNMVTFAILYVVYNLPYLVQITCISSLKYGYIGSIVYGVYFALYNLLALAH